ncbi:MAG: hypothetical protein SGILL_009931, partial [Bacillariaceae sp.]
ALKHLRTEMELDVKLRKERYEFQQDSVSTLVSDTFGRTLALKDSSGSVLFDHEDKELYPTFVPDSCCERRSEHERGMLTLSGGERSVSTIALLLALGESTDNPFRAMDEFDVFLDAVTRKKVIDHLIEIGKTMSNRQFIFLTPQDISDVDADDTMIKIFRIPNPNRRRLDFDSGSD